MCDKYDRSRKKKKLFDIIFYYLKVINIKKYILENVFILGRNVDLGIELECYK